MQLVGSIEYQKLVLMSDQEFDALKLIEELRARLVGAIIPVTLESRPDKSHVGVCLTPNPASNSRFKSTLESRAALHAIPHPASRPSNPVSPTHSPSAPPPPAMPAPPPAPARPFGLPPQKWAPRPDAKRNKVCKICAAPFTDKTRQNTCKICGKPACKLALRRSYKHHAKKENKLSPEAFRDKRIALIKAATEKANAAQPI